MDGLGRSQWRRGGLEGIPRGSVHQWSQILITLMRSRIRIRKLVTVKGCIRIRIDVKSWIRIRIKWCGSTTRPVGTHAITSKLDFGNGQATWVGEVTDTSMTNYSILKYYQLTGKQNYGFIQCWRIRYGTWYVHVQPLVQQQKFKQKPLIYLR